MALRNFRIGLYHNVPFRLTWCYEAPALSLFSVSIPLFTPVRQKSELCTLPVRASLPVFSVLFTSAYTP